MKQLITLMFTAWALLAGIEGCKADYPDTLPGHNQTQAEDQGIQGPLHVDQQWQTVTFAKPLLINRKGTQDIHIGLNPEHFTDSATWHIQHTSGFTIGDLLPDERYNGNGIRRLSDGTLIEPDIRLVADNGQTIPVTMIGVQRWSNGAFSIMCGLLSGKAPDQQPLAYPEDITTFTAIQIRSDIPFDATYFLWRMDYYPGLY
ncbi:hypothetical protein WH50_11525 [Pokkaliibacter plantistimulans]|uniref:Uncharacterized protein n=1 Tax=Pokkaliibacter plantistimulans TaxID=1635171 RepID=A0ABX5M0P9_9GAMM|nr:hypothetical protein [Pokkaliibacter plantistimulans]PXF31146.1 hypothetical protein WH50_11525 [Pokkaliibacter plantistimulans]